MDKLKRAVLEANAALPGLGLVCFTWGNVSAVDRGRGLVVIKPSGVPYGELSADALSVVELAGGRHVAGLKPSSDTAAHLEIYRAMPGAGAVVHTHSRWATIFAQAGRDIPLLGTTHADDFRGSVPCSRELREDEVREDYEANTGRLIAATAVDGVPAVLARGHGPFVWAGEAGRAVYLAAVLEEAAMMAWHTLMLAPGAAGPAAYIAEKHWQRKHGRQAYYGQNP